MSIIILLELWSIAMIKLQNLSKMVVTLLEL